jgi:hypothetical protein
MQRKPAGNSASTDRQPPDDDALAFRRLFADAYRRCFSAELAAPLTESESHRLSVDIAEGTGLEIGWKSLKNYSSYLLGRASRVENPSVPTLDTLARYVAGAPRTDEEQRRARERDYSYWFRYRDELRRTESVKPVERPADPELATAAGTTVSVDDRSTSARRPFAFAAATLVTLAAVLLPALVTMRGRVRQSTLFADEFDDVSTSALASRGWCVRDIEPVHWGERGVTPGHLTLFTLAGDNWPQPGVKPGIRNLLVRHVSSDCFDVDVRFTSFFPRQNWQQAGILLLEDTAFVGRSVRMTIGYNDFSGGFPSTREILVQAITARGRGSDQPEEIVHDRLFVLDSASEPLVRGNLASSALRMEKREGHLRLLHSVGSMKNAAFKEDGSTEFAFRPAYVAVVAMKGFVGRSAEVPVLLDAFTLAEMPCAR